MEEAKPIAATVDTGATLREAPGLSLAFTARPNILRCLIHASWPKRTWEPALGFPQFQATWEGHRAGTFGLRAFGDLTGLHPRDEFLPSLYWHVLGFPLQFAILTHPAYPIPIWRVKQVRNHLLLHRPLRVGTPVQITARVVGWRAMDRRSA